MNGTPTKSLMTVTHAENKEGQFAYCEIRVRMPDGTPGHWLGSTIPNESPFEDMPPITEAEAIANADLFAEAGTVYAETGLTPQELVAVRDRLRRVIEILRETGGAA